MLTVSWRVATRRTYRRSRALGHPFWGIAASGFPTGSVCGSGGIAAGVTRVDALPRPANPEEDSCVRALRSRQTDRVLRLPGRGGRRSWPRSSSRPGEDKKAQPSIAGGYDLQAPNDCFGTPPAPAAGKPLPATAPPQAAVAGPSFDVKQSGQFVNLSNTQGTLGGKLRLEEDANADGSRPLDGDVIVRQRRRRRSSRAPPRRVTRARSSARSAAQQIAADLKRDPPDAGAAKPRAPGSIASLYKLSPRSTCFGGKFELEGSGSSYTRQGAAAGARNARLRQGEGRRHRRRRVHEGRRGARQGPGRRPQPQQLPADPARRGGAHRAGGRQRQAARDDARPGSPPVGREVHRDQAARVLRAPRRQRSSSRSPW